MIGIKKAEMSGRLIHGFTCFSCGAPQCYHFGQTNYLHVLNFPLATTKSAEMGYCCKACGRTVTGHAMRVEEKLQIKNSRSMVTKFLKYNAGIYLAVFIFMLFKLMADQRF